MISSNHATSIWETFVEDGQTAHLLGQFHKAELLYTIALSGAREARQDRSGVVARLLVLLGDLYAEQGRLARAESTYRQSLQIYDDAETTFSIDTAIVLKRISEMCRAQSNFNEADDFRCRGESIVSHISEGLDLLWEKEQCFSRKVGCWADTASLAEKLETLAGSLIPIGGIIVTIISISCMLPTKCRFNADPSGASANVARGEAIGSRISKQLAARAAVIPWTRAARLYP